jgi:hypothetical protein
MTMLAHIYLVGTVDIIQDTGSGLILLALDEIRRLLTRLPDRVHAWPGHGGDDVISIAPTNHCRRRHPT